MEVQAEIAGHHQGIKVVGLGQAMLVASYLGIKEGLPHMVVLVVTVAVPGSHRRCHCSRMNNLNGDLALEAVVLSI